MPSERIFFLDLRLSLLTVTPGRLVIAQPFVILIVHARMASFDRAVIDGARDLGPSAWTAFRTIAFSTIGGCKTLPTLVWGMLRTFLDPTVNAMATPLIALSIGSCVLALSLSRYRG